MMRSTGSGHHRVKYRYQLTEVPGVEERIRSFCSNVSFHPYVGRNNVYQIPAFGDDGMDANAVFIPKSLPLCVYRIQCQLSSVQGVDATFRCHSRMGSTSDKPDVFRYEPVGRRRPAGSPFMYVRSRRMDHLGHVDVVENTQTDQFLLAGQKSGESPADQSEPIFDLDVLFRRNRQKHNSSCQFTRNTGIHESGGGSQHSRNLCVVPARMCCSGPCAGTRMIRNEQRIKLSHQRDRRPGS